MTWVFRGISDKCKIFRQILPRDSFIAMRRDEYAVFKPAIRHQSYVDIWLQQGKFLILNILRL